MASELVDATEPVVEEAPVVELTVEEQARALASLTVSSKVSSSYLEMAKELCLDDVLVRFISV